MKSLKSKLILSFIPFAILTMVFISIVNFLFSKKIIYDNTNEILTQAAQSNANQIDAWLSRQIEIVDNIKQTIQFMNLTEENEKNYLSDMLNKCDSFLNMYIGTPEGRMILGKDVELPKDFDPRKRDWYVEAMKSDNLVLTKPYIDEATKSLVISVSGKMKHIDGSVKGVISVDISLDTITTLISNIKHGKSGYAYLVNNVEGTMLAHSDSSLILQNVGEVENGVLRDLYEKIITGKEESCSYNYKGSKIISKIAPIPNTDWSIVVTVKENEILSELNTLQFQMATILLIAIVMITIGIERTIQHFVKPIKNIEKDIKTIAVGDFTKEIDHKAAGRNDEIGMIARGISDMKENLKRLILSIKKEAYHIEADVNNVVQHVKQLEDNITDISATTDELAAGMEETAASTEEMSAMSQDIENSVPW